MLEARWKRLQGCSREVQAFQQEVLFPLGDFVGKVTKSKVQRLDDESVVKSFPLFRWLYGSLQNPTDSSLSLQIAGLELHLRTSRNDELRSERA